MYGCKSSNKRLKTTKSVEVLCLFQIGAPAAFIWCGRDGGVGIMLRPTYKKSEKAMSYC